MFSVAQIVRVNGQSEEDDLPLNIRPPVGGGSVGSTAPRRALDTIPPPPSGRTASALPMVNCERRTGEVNVASAASGLWIPEVPDSRRANNIHFDPFLRRK